MDLKEEYNKRIEIIKSKQLLRKKKNTIFVREQEEKISNIKIKIQNLKQDLENALQQKSLYQEKLNNIIINNDSIPSKVEFLDNNYQHKIELLYVNNELENERLNEKKDIFVEKNTQQKNKILEQFNEQNLPLINKKKKYEKEILKITDDLEYNNRLLRFEIKTQSTSLGDRFRNRKKNISILEERTNNLKQFRKNQKDLYNKIKKKELELKRFNSDVDSVNRKNLSYLNSYIKSQRLLIKNDNILENKKKHFENIRIKNDEYKKMIVKQKEQRKNIENELEILKNKLKNITNLPKLELVKKKDVNKLNIEKIKKQIGELNYKLTSNQIENQSNSILLETNQSKFSIKLSELEMLLEDYKDNHNSIIRKNNISFDSEYNNLVKAKEDEIKENKKLLWKFLNQTIYILYQNKLARENNKILNLGKKENEEIIISNQGKIKNNEYILDKMEIKFEIEKLDREEKDNLLSIEELLEIQDLNQKFLSMNE